MLENIALYQSTEQGTNSYRCIPTIRGKDYFFHISIYSAKRLTSLMQAKKVQADINIYWGMVAMHYWTTHKDHS